jgi:hypothetical protein
LLVDVLDELEADDEVEGAVREVPFQLVGRGLDESKVLMGMV